MCNNIEKDLVRQIKNAYHRKWQQANPEKVRQAQERYWAKKTIKELQLEERSNK